MTTASPRESRNQLAAGAFLALWSLAGWWSFLTTPELRRADYGVDPGPDLLPLIVLTCLSLGALSLITSGLRRIVSEPGDHRYWRKLLAGSLVPMLFVASVVVYAFAMNAIGYVISSAAMTFVWITVLGLRDREQSALAAALQAAIATIVGIAAIYVVFVYLIGVPVR